MFSKNTSRMRGQAAIESGCRPTAGCLHGQAATEYLVLAGFALVFILPLAFLFFSASNSELGKTSISQASAAANAIADEAGKVYLQGNGSKETIIVNYPSGINGGTLAGGLVVLRIYADSRQQDMVASTFANLTGNLSGARGAGLQKISLVSMGDYVNVTYG